MNEEAVKLGKKQLQKGVTYEQIAVLFTEQTFEVVHDAMQILKNDEFDAVEQSNLPKVENELDYFFLFAIDYWWQKSPSYTQEQKRILEKVLFHHLGIVFGDDAQGRAMWDALQERFIAYGQIATELEQKDLSLMVSDFAMKLSEYCGLRYLSSTILLPSLFKTALDTVSVLKADKRGLK